MSTVNEQNDSSLWLPHLWFGLSFPWSLASSWDHSVEAQNFSLLLLVWGCLTVLHLHWGGHTSWGELQSMTSTGLPRLLSLGLKKCVFGEFFYQVDQADHISRRDRHKRVTTYHHLSAVYLLEQGWCLRAWLVSLGASSRKSCQIWLSLEQLLFALKR